MSSVFRRLRRCAAVPRTRAALLLLLSTWLISACDGGIFGTGDTNSDDPIIASNAMDNASGTMEGQDAGADAGIADPSDTDIGIDVDDAQGQTEGSDGDNAPQLTEQPDADTPEQTQRFSNTVAGYPGVEPQLRFVNASDQQIRVMLRRMSGAVEMLELAPESVSSHSRLEIGESLIDIMGSDASLPSTRIVASLGLSSVSTVLIRSSNAPAMSISVLPLETQTTTDDESLARLRIVAPEEDSRLSQGVWSLTPSGDNPGSADANLSAISNASSDTSYSSVAAGDYDVSVDGEPIGLPTISLAGGRVKTLIVSGSADAPRLLDVDDSELDGL